MTGPSLGKTPDGSVPPPVASVPPPAAALPAAPAASGAAWAAPAAAPAGAPGAPGHAGDRMDQFRQELATLSVTTPADGDDRRLLVIGILLVLAGAGAIFAGYWTASGTEFLLDQIPAMISGGLFGVALVAVGSALFVRYSMTRYFRYWLVREIYEQRLQTDRVVDALERVEAALRSGRPG